MTEVLVVSSDEGSSRSLVTALRQRGLQPLWVGNIQAARDVLRTLDHPVVFSEWKLNDGSALDLLAAPPEESPERSPRLVVRLDGWADATTLRRLDQPSVEAVVPATEDVTLLAGRLADLVRKAKQHSTFDDLRKAFLPRMIERFEALVELLSTALRRRDDDSIDEPRRIAHQLRGTAGSYGFESAGEVAGLIETELRMRGSGADLETLRHRALETVRALESDPQISSRRSPTVSTSGSTSAEILPETLDEVTASPSGNAPWVVRGAGGRVCLPCHIVWPSDTNRCGVCNGPLEDAQDDVIDGRYRKLSKIGQGSVGAVWKGVDIALERDVALKFLVGGRFAGAESVRRFQGEAAALAAIRHPHVADVYAFGLHGDALYFAMEYIHGRPLREILEAHRRHRLFVPIHRALVICRDIASGLSAVHAARLIHRDVKPENVIIERGSGRAVVVDLGLALANVERAGSQSGVHGTPAYMAPEQITREGRITPQTDVYALGCTVFELLTNELPFEGESISELLEQHRFREPPYLSDLRPELRPLDLVVARAMRKAPRERWDSVAEMASALVSAGANWLRPLKRVAPSGSRPPSLPAPTFTAGTMRLLIVDDDVDFSALVRRAAEETLPERVRVTQVMTGIEALELASRGLPQLVVLDYQMPDMDGIETLSRLRELPGGRDLKVIVASAAAGDAERFRFDTLGIDCFVRKPVRPRDLSYEIGRLARSLGWLPASDRPDGRDLL